MSSLQYQWKLGLDPKALAASIGSAKLASVSRIDSAGNPLVSLILTDDAVAADVTAIRAVSEAPPYSLVFVQQIAGSFTAKATSRPVVGNVSMGFFEISSADTKGTLNTAASV